MGSLIVVDVMCYELCYQIWRLVSFVLSDFMSIFLYCLFCSWCGKTNGIMQCIINGLSDYFLISYAQICFVSIFLFHFSFFDSLLFYVMQSSVLGTCRRFIARLLLEYCRFVDDTLSN